MRGTNRYSAVPAYSQILLRQHSTLGPFFLLDQSGIFRLFDRVMHCALFLHVAMQIGLSHLLEKGARRIVSEDSGDRPVFPADCPHRQIVTAAAAASTYGCSEFPAYSQVYLRNYNVRSLRR